MEIHFSAPGMLLKRPVVEDVVELDVKNERGFLEFNGHFYAEDDDLPFAAKMSIRNRERYEVVIYRRKILERTSVYSDEVDGMRVCWTPSNRIQIWFQILRKMDLETAK